MDISSLKVLLQFLRTESKHMFHFWPGGTMTKGITTDFLVTSCPPKKILWPSLKKSRVIGQSSFLKFFQRIPMSRQRHRQDYWRRRTLLLREPGNGWNG